VKRKELLPCLPGKKALYGMIFLLVFALIISGCGGKESQAPPEETPTEIKIGALAPLSGVLAPLGEAMKQGADLAAEVLNAQGGMNGRQVVLIWEDDKGDPETAAERARKLIEQDKVELMLGSIASSSTVAVLPVVERAKIPFMYVIDGEVKTNSTVDQTQVSPYVFGNALTPTQMWSAVADILLEEGGNKFYFLGNDYLYSRLVAEVGIDILKAKGAEVVGDDYVPMGTTDFSLVIGKIEASGADVVWNTTVGTDAISFARQAHQFGLYDKAMVTGLSGLAADMYPALHGFVDNAYTVNVYCETIDNPQNEEFVRLYREKYKNEWPIAPVSATAYSTLMLYNAAAEEAGGFDPDALRAALEGMVLDVPQGQVEVMADNHVVNMPLYWMQISDGRYNVVKGLGRFSHPGFEGSSVK
jgi:ABC-type branched-subunit amino acid transport system substrate-binding protein